ncbi:MULTISPECIES: GAF domain-containing protein [Streptomyces]|uniref:GAF domain-containing protein n=1 Tax=Streptomyces TaxID=1883 RepID=UPI000CD4D56F|nr:MULTISPECIES: GAF domain-containing protein [Streptomyces]
MRRRYDPTSHLLLTPEDPDAAARVRRLAELGIGTEALPELDAFARRLAAVTEAPYAMVNFIDENRQFFAGLHTPVDDGPPRGPASAPRRGPGRVMARDYGYCPHVVVRRKALVLEDVRDYPRFAGNPLVDEIGIRSYLGAPLLECSGEALGTVCVVDTRPRAWGREGLETIKATAAELTGLITGRRPVE